MEKSGLAGVGLVLTGESDLTGIDLDDCINDAGGLSKLAAEIVSYGETYAEVSPSGEGIRLFARGKVKTAMKDEATGIEIYGDGRLSTMTGQHIPDTPEHIAEAPRTLARLTAVIEGAREARKQKSATNGDARAHGSDFFRSLKDVALARLDEWVPSLLRAAVKQPNGAWRVTSKDLGRDYEEDLLIHPSGIADFGPEKGLTPIDLVIEYGGAPDPIQAAMWLCERMRIAPAALGMEAGSIAGSEQWAYAKHTRAQEVARPCSPPAKSTRRRSVRLRHASSKGAAVGRGCFRTDAMPA